MYCRCRAEYYLFPCTICIVNVRYPDDKISNATMIVYIICNTQNIKLVPILDACMKFNM